MVRGLTYGMAVLMTGIGLVASGPASASGPVVGWGDNSSGQTISPSGSRTASAIAADGGHTLAIETPVPEPGLGLSLLGGIALLTGLRSGSPRRDEQQR